jgi:cell wall-associated NlpC family hydrolase
MDLLIQYAMSFIGVPYRWGGSNPITGFDCSGLVQEILKSVYMDPPGDQTAEALYQYFLLIRTE